MAAAAQLGCNRGEREKLLLAAAAVLMIGRPSEPPEAPEGIRSSSQQEEDLLFKMVGVG